MNALRRTPWTGHAISAVGMLVTAAAHAQEGLLDTASELPAGDGWRGFADLGLLAGLVASLLLAALLGAALGFHPRTYRKIGRPAQLETPKTFVIYAVVGAVVGVLVARYGPIMGLVVFGLGGLARFRTVLESPTKTGKAILATLIGLCCGLGLPHVAVVVTLFAFALVFALESGEVFRIVIKGLDEQLLAQAADAYREAFAREQCQIVDEQKNFNKREISFVIRAGRHGIRATLQEAFRTAVPEALRGTVDWRRR